MYNLIDIRTFWIDNNNNNVHEARDKLSFVLQTYSSSKFNPGSKLLNLSETDISMDITLSHRQIICTAYTCPS